MTPWLETKNLSKRFGDFTAVDDVSLSFAPGRIHAVLGENGAGKSTLMRLLFGLHAPNAGEIHLDRRPVRMTSAQVAIDHGLGMVQQHFTLVDTLSAIDNIMLGAETCARSGRLDRKAAVARMEAQLPSAQLSVPWSAPVGELSVGQKQRVEILKLLFREARILVLDEPTAVLTPAEIEDFFAMLRKLKAQGRTIILITHKIGEVMRLCDSFTVLRAGRLVAQGEVGAVNVEKIVEHMIGRPLAELKVVRRLPSAEKLLAVEKLCSKGGGRGQVRDVSLKLHAGEIVGIAGVEGSGQSALVDAVLGLRDFTGRIELAGRELPPLATAEARRRGLGLIPEDRLHQALWLNESCHVNMMIGLEELFTRHGLLETRKMETATSEWSAGFDVRASSLRATAGSLSGGNQQKLVFAREVTGRAPKVLLCHQPTRGVDLGAIDLIHRRMLELRNQGVGLLLLSSELEELIKLCDRIYVFFAGEIAATFSRADFSAERIGAAMTGIKHA